MVKGLLQALQKAEYWSDLHFEIHLNSSSQYEQLVVLKKEKHLIPDVSYLFFPLQIYL